MANWNVKAPTTVTAPTKAKALVAAHQGTTVEKIVAPAPTPTPDQSRHEFWTAIDLNPDFSNIVAAAKRYAFVILADTRLAEKRALQAGGCKVLAYKNLTLMTPWTNAGVPLSDGPPDSYYLHNKAGQRISSTNFPAASLANPADPGYQKRWGGDVAAQLERDVWDGVFMDDCNPSPSYHHDPNDIRELQGVSGYSGAVGSMLAGVTPTIHGTGKLAVANIGSINDYPVTRSWVADYLDGAMWEWWSGSQSDRATAAAAQAAGRFILARQAGGDAPSGFKSLMSVAPSSYFACQTDYTHEPAAIA